jgi:flagellum-specific peptidoglycan hydrolase FlgJ
MANRKDQDAFLVKARDAALAAGHPWPEYAACEAALESRWGTSKLCVQGNNLFGEKQHLVPIFGTMTLMTWEDLNKDGKPEPEEYIKGVKWVKFPDWSSCFKSRIDTISRLANEHRFSGYAAALKAADGEEFVREVSKNWATDPLRADKVLAIHHVHKSAFNPSS